MYALALFTHLSLHTSDSWLVTMCICITSGAVFHYRLSTLHCTIHLLERNVRKNTGTDSSRGLPSRIGLDWKSTSICLEMCPACRAERAACQPLCTCVSAQQFLEGNSLAPVELLLGLVWLWVLLVKSLPLVCLCVCFLSFEVTKFRDICFYI